MGSNPSESTKFKHERYTMLNIIDELKRGNYSVDLINLVIEELESNSKELRKLYALEASGVHNWEWYGDAMEELYAEDDRD